MVFSVESKGKEYYLHRKGHLLFFSKQKTGCIEKPREMMVKINKKTGLPFLKKE